MKKYLITGGAGFIGSALTRSLVGKGYEVTVFDDQSRGTLQRLEDIKNKFIFIDGDIRDKDAVAKACEGIGSVIHLAFVNGTEFFYTKPDLVLDVGVKGIVNILDACLRNNIKDFILASSSEVYQNASIIPTPETIPLIIPDPLNPRYSYAAGKIISELMTINYGRKHFKRAVIFRPHNVYGPAMGWEHVIPQFALRLKANKNAKKMNFPIQGTGNEIRSFIYIDDFIDGLLKVVFEGEHLNIYHIGTMEEITITQLAKKVAKCFGMEIQIKPTEKLIGSTKRRCPDISKLMKLGFKPKVSLEEGLRKTIEWYIHHEQN